MRNLIPLIVVTLSSCATPISQFERTCTELGYVKNTPAHWACVERRYVEEREVLKAMVAPYYVIGPR